MEHRWLDLDDADRTWAARTKEFVDEVATPYLLAHQDDEWAADPAARVPWEVLEAADTAGVRRMALPSALGGDDVSSVLTYAVVAEELARGESALVDILLQGWKIASMLRKAGDPGVVDPLLTRFAAEPGFLFSHCSTEPQGSSDRWLGYDAVESAMSTTAVHDGGEWVLAGRKQYITNGPDSSLYVMYATTTPGVAPSQGTSSFVVPRDTPGFSVGEVFEKIGGRLFNNAELILDGCRLPDSHLLIRDTRWARRVGCSPGPR
ncbi:MAG: acyl-CoA dehydrogenase family protein [Acidimicrobiia bacterium]